MYFKLKPTRELQKMIIYPDQNSPRIKVGQLIGYHNNTSYIKLSC